VRILVAHDKSAAVVGKQLAHSVVMELVDRFAEARAVRGVFAEEVVDCSLEVLHELVDVVGGDVDVVRADAGLAAVAEGAQRYLLSCELHV